MYGFDGYFFLCLFLNSSCGLFFGFIQRNRYRLLFVNDKKKLSVIAIHVDDDDDDGGGWLVRWLWFVVVVVVPRFVSVVLVAQPYKQHGVRTHKQNNEYKNNINQNRINKIQLSRNNNTCSYCRHMRYRHLCCAAL